MDLEHIHTVHNYRRLARQGFVPPLTHSCGQEYTVRATETEVVFQCFGCDVIHQPGLADLKGMQARIEDYHAKRNYET